MNENQNEYVDINAHDNYPDSDQKIEIPTMKVIPLKKICMTIGALPTSYLETLSYYEMLVWFIEYLKNNIIPTINNNASAVQEVQSVVLALQNYINDYKDSIDSDVEELEEYMNNYFENLDVQEEINNKLDQMLEDGVLTEIIQQFLQSSALWCFDNVADMKQATNLINGSFAKTLGYYEINDGGEAYYKIRTITNDDDVDEMTIIALYDNTLIAELIEENIMNPMQYGIRENENIGIMLEKCNSKINLLNKKYIVNDIINFKSGKIENGEIEITTNTGTINLFNKNDILINKLHIYSNYQYNNADFNKKLINIHNSKNIIISNSNISYSDTGITISNSKYINIFNNIFENSKNGALQISHHSDDGVTYTLENVGCKNIEIHNNTFTSGYEGIKLAYYIENCEIHNNNCYGNSRDGIDYAGHYIDGLFIHDNNIYNNTINGIEVKQLNPSYFTPVIQDKIIKNVKIHSNTIKHSSSYSGINIQNEESDTQCFSEIYENYIDLYGNGRGIRIINTNLSSENNIKNNILKGNNNFGIGIGIINTSNVNILNNSIKNITNHGIFCEQQETSANNHSNIIIKGNDISSKSNAVRLNSTFENCIITENILDAPSSQYLITDSGTNNYTLLNTVPYKITSMNGNTPVLENSATPRMEIGTIIFNKTLSTTNSVGLIATSKAQLSSATFSKYIEISNI